MKVLIPVGENKVLLKNQLAPRLADLKGKVVGILDNRAGKAYFDRIEELLKEKCGVKQVIHLIKPEQTRPAPKTQIDELVKACVAVIAGTGV
jgi:hypothetical protein